MDLTRLPATAYLAVTNLLDTMHDTHAVTMARFALEAMQVLGAFKVHCLHEINTRYTSGFILAKGHPWRGEAAEWRAEIHQSPLRMQIRVPLACTSVHINQVKPTTYCS